MWWIILIAVAVIVVLWAISVQNKLVGADEKCNNALSQIGVQQASRWDALTALADLTKGYADHEYKALMDIIAARQPVGPSTTAEVVAQQDDLLSQVATRFMAVAEAYPDLKANQSYIETMRSVKEYEEHVRMSRMVYNDTITMYNRIVRSFPSSVAAGIFGFKERGLLPIEQAKAEMPSMLR